MDPRRRGAAARPPEETRWSAPYRSVRPNGPGEPSPGMRPKADSPGPRNPRIRGLTGRERGGRNGSLVSQLLRPFRPRTPVTAAAILKLAHDPHPPARCRPSGGERSACTLCPRYFYSPRKNTSTAFVWPPTSITFAWYLRRFPNWSRLWLSWYRSSISIRPLCGSVRNSSSCDCPS